MTDKKNDAALVAVFRADEPEVLPLVEAALEQEGIEYLIRPIGTQMPEVFGHRAEFGGAVGAADVLVNAADEARALNALASLADAPDTPAGAPLQASASQAAPAAAGPAAYRLSESESGALVGDITDAQFECLADELEEESGDDRDYYIDAATIDVLQDSGADAALLAMLRRALGSREGIEITWAKL